MYVEDWIQVFSPGRDGNYRKYLRYGREERKYFHLVEEMDTIKYNKVMEDRNASRRLDSSIFTWSRCKLQKIIKVWKRGKQVFSPGSRD